MPEKHETREVTVLMSYYEDAPAFRKVLPRGASVQLPKSMAQQREREGFVELRREPLPGETKEHPDKDLEGHTVEELTALAESFEPPLEVEGTGKDGRVLKADLIAAIAAAREAKASGAGEED